MRGGKGKRERGEGGGGRAREGRGRAREGRGRAREGRGRGRARSGEGGRGREEREAKGRGWGGSRRQQDLVIMSNFYRLLTQDCCTQVGKLNQPSRNLPEELQCCY